MQIIPHVIHEFSEFAVKINFITTLLVTKFGGPEALGPLIFKRWGTSPTGPIGWLRLWHS